MVCINPYLERAVRARPCLGLDLLPHHATRLEQIRAARRAAAATLAAAGFKIDLERFGTPPPDPANFYQLADRA